MPMMKLYFKCIDWQLVCGLWHDQVHLLVTPGYCVEPSFIKSWCATSQWNKKLCLSLRYCGTEIIYFSGLLFRLKQNLVCDSKIECTKGKSEFLSKIPNCCEGNWKSRTKTNSQNLEEQNKMQNLNWRNTSWSFCRILIISLLFSSCFYQL